VARGGIEPPTQGFLIFNKFILFCWHFESLTVQILILEFSVSESRAASLKIDWLGLMPLWCYKLQMVSYMIRLVYAYTNPTKYKLHHDSIL
jgi:hypothetical protein